MDDRERSPETEHTAGPDGLIAWNGLEPRRARAMEMLAGGKGMVETAAALGIGRNTLWRWTREPEFRRLLDEMRCDAVDAARRTLVLEAENAAKVIVEAVRGLEPPQSAVHAAGKLLDAIGIKSEQPVNVAIAPVRVMDVTTARKVMLLESGDDEEEECA